MTNAKKTILIADESEHVLEKVIHFFEKNKEYQLITCKEGEAVLKHLEKGDVDLFIIDLLLPKYHGIDLLKTIKSKDKNLGVIITSWEPMVQNHRAAINFGVDYFLDKPFTEKFLFSLIESFFYKTLKPRPFKSLIEKKETGEHCFVPKSTESNSYIKFWGTRGSSSVSGAEYLRFGGHTPCLEIHTPKNLIIIDAGTGIRDLGHEIVENNLYKDIHIFLGHTHLDHIAGFPSFAPLYHKGYKITIYGPLGFYKSTKELFAEMLTHAFFPVDLQEVQAEVNFVPLHTTDPITIDNITINTHHTFHPGPTLGFKINIDKMTFGYITDNEVLMGYFGDPNLIHDKHPLLDPHLSLIEFLKGCDFLVHEAQYTSETYPSKIGWGHSSISNATVFLKYVGVKLWIVTHHDPSDTDLIIQNKHQIHHDLLEHCNVECQVRMAYDRLKIAF